MIAHTHALSTSAAVFATTQRYRLQLLNLRGLSVAASVTHPVIGPSLLSNIESSGQSG